MLSPSLSPRPGTPNLKEADPKEDFFASSLCIILFFWVIVGH